MKTKKIYLVVLVVIIIGGLFWLLANKSKPSDNNPIKIGASGSIDWQVRLVGRASCERNENGGR